MRSYLAAAVILLSAGLTSSASAQTPAQQAITRNSIINLSPQETARLVLGPIGNMFVERAFSPFKLPQSDSVLDFIVFTSKPRPALAGMCRITRLVVTFSPVAPESVARPNADTPVNPVDIRAEQRFIIVDSLGAPSRDRSEACERVSSTANSFQAVSELDAHDNAAALDLVVRAATRQGELFFTLICEVDNADCKNPRDQLSKLNAQAILNVGNGNCKNTDRSNVCYGISVSDPVDANYYWVVEIVCTLPAKRPVSVWLQRRFLPIP